MEEKKQIKLSYSSPKKNGYPILGVAEKVGEKYAVRNRAIVGKVYSIICPECQEVLLVKAASAVRYKKTCKKCGTSVSFMGKEAVKNEAPNETPTENVNKTQKYGKKSHSGDNHTSTGTNHTDSASGNNASGGNGTVKTGKPNAKLTWGSFFNKNSYVFRRIGEHYLGRDDDEIRSDISIHDEYVSRRSVVINVIPKGGIACGYKLTVKKASNPVLVNGQTIEEGESIYLNYGDTILVGNTTLTFKQNK